MFYFGKASKKQMEGVDDRIIAVAEDALKNSPIDFGCTDGLRTIEEQRTLYLSGASKIMKSFHLPQENGKGWALDLVPYVNGKPRWEWPLIFRVATQMQASAIKLGVGITWGAVWDRDLRSLSINLPSEVEKYKLRHPGSDFLDGPHYQLRG